MIWLMAQTGFIALALAGVMIAISQERKKRENFEKASSFKFKIINSKIEKLSAEMTENQLQIGKNTKKITELSQKPTQTPAPAIKKSQNEAVFAENYLKNLVKALPESKLVANLPQEPAEEPEFTDMVINELVHHAIKTQQVEMFVQPVQRLPQRKTQAYEIFARIRARAGTFIPANQYMSLAQQNRVMAEIDKLVLMRCLKMVQDTPGGNAPYFINITSATLKNPSFMKVLLGFLSSHRALAPRLIFEMQKNDYEALQGPVKEILRGLGKLGCAFSLDHVTDFSFNMSRLQDDKIRHVKVSAKFLAQQDAFKMNMLKKQMDDNGIMLIAEKVESEQNMRALLDLDITMGQGYLFGKPAPEETLRKRAA